MPPKYVTTGGGAGSSEEERKSQRLIEKKKLQEKSGKILDPMNTETIEKVEDTTPPEKILDPMNTETIEKVEDTTPPKQVEASTQMEIEINSEVPPNWVSNFKPNFLQNYAYPYPPLPYNIPEFGGTKSEQVDDWLVTLEAIGQQHEWPENIILKQAVSRLYGSALRWYEIHKTTICTWENFKNSINRDFGENDRKEYLISRLNNKMQGEDETSLRFVEEILHLCQQIDAGMDLQEKIDHVTMGLNETLAFALLMKPALSIGELLETCRKYDIFKEKRRLRKNGHNNSQWERKNDYFSNKKNMWNTNDHYNRSRWNTNRNNWNTNIQPTKNTWNLNANRNSWNARDQPPPTSPQHNNNWNTRAQPPPTSPRTWNRNAPRQTNYIPSSQPRRADEMRTKENKPICFICNRPGHVAKYCRQKQIRAIHYEDPIYSPINDQQPHNYYKNRSNHDFDEPHNYYKNRSNQDFDEVQSTTYADICRPTRMLQNQRPTYTTPTSNRYAELEYEHNLN